MLNLSRSKALIVFILFASLVIAGIGILARQGQEGRITDATSATEPLDSEQPDALAPDGVGSADGSARTGPPALFPDAELVTQRDYQAAYSELYQESPKLFAERVARALDGPYPLSAKQAALAAWYRWHSADRTGAIRGILLEEADPRRPLTDEQRALQAFAVDLLAKEAPKALETREVLASFIESKPEDSGLRQAAWSAVLRWGRIKEVHRCLPSLYAESDPDCLQASAEALSQTREGAATAILRELSKRHPRAEARVRFKQILARR